MQQLLGTARLRSFRILFPHGGISYLNLGITLICCSISTHPLPVLSFYPRTEADGSFTTRQP